MPQSGFIRSDRIGTIGRIDMGVQQPQPSLPKQRRKAAEQGKRSETCNSSLIQMPQMCHVWTAPAPQGDSDDQRSVPVTLVRSRWSRSSIIVLTVFRPRLVSSAIARSAIPRLQLEDGLALSIACCQRRADVARRAHGGIVFWNEAIPIAIMVWRRLVLK